MKETCTITKLIDNSKVRVTRFEFAPNEETGWHIHEFDYVITAITKCQMSLEHPDGSETLAEVAEGDSYYRDRGVRHNVINASQKPMTFLEVELKS